jgi:hypothetical protein
MTSLTALHETLPAGAFSFWGNTKQMKRTFTHCLAALSVLIVLISSSIVFGQAKINMDDNRWVSIGGGLRTAYRSTETAPDSGAYFKDFNLDNIRLYVNSQVHKDFQVEFNTDYDGSGDIMVLDAVVKYSPRPYLNFWMGRHLTPSDRANLDGPFFLNAYDYPGLVSRYPGIFAGRDNGFLVNGDIQGGKFKYAFGIYEGMQSFGEGDSLLYAGRAVVNFFDPEPGYYNSSTYYSEKDILALGFAFQHQSDVVFLGPNDFEAFTGYNFDLLFEKKLGEMGAASLEGAWYNYDYEGQFGHGSGYLAEGAFLFNKEIGIGKFQPYFRYQDFKGVGNDDTSIIDTGLNYIIRGHSARLSAFWTVVDPPGLGDEKSNQFTIGTQFQF